MFSFFHILDIDIIIQVGILAILSTLLTFALLRFGMWAFERLGILDRPHLYPHERHRAPIPYGLGIVLYLDFVVLSLLFLDLSVEKLRTILFLGFIISLVSFLDDLNTIGKFRKIKPIVRLALQIGVGAVIGLTSIKIGYVSGLLGGIVHLDAYYFSVLGMQVYTIPLLITVFWYVLVFNSINWSDCVPGLACGFSWVALLIIGVLTLKLYIVDVSPHSIENSEFVFLVLAILLPAILTIYPSEVGRRCIMGDSGTMYLAFMVATLAIISGGKIATAASALGIYLIDALYVIIMRLSAGQNPLHGDHIHHLHFRLMRLGLSQAYIRWTIYTLSLLFGLSAVFLDPTGKTLLFGILVVIVFLMTRIITLIKK